MNEDERKLQHLDRAVWTQAALIGLWSLVLVAAVLGLWIRSLGLVLLGVAFVSLCSIYANLGAHWSVYVAKRSEREAFRASLSGETKGD